MSSADYPTLGPSAAEVIVEELAGNPDRCAVVQPPVGPEQHVRHLPEGFVAVEQTGERLVTQTHDLQAIQRALQRATRVDLQPVAESDLIQAAVAQGLLPDGDGRGSA